ncbi:NAD(P)-binding protein [Lepidopterella palustris CBS 459.81]|uniref:NAD(P)-binding protein n=1 Tax=Lepidopterella palustris CBS 459.81 TaxID=1314670 RepID=A0A8E2EBF4_9PEZI|nr:NAD(P)-binding protein [Lepidopterella palustris CBS 459.81]
MSESKSQLEFVHYQSPPGQSELKGPAEGCGYQIYKAAGKHSNKRATIAGGGSSIGRAIAILFGMEGADSFIAYLPPKKRRTQLGNDILVNNAAYHKMRGDASTNKVSKHQWFHTLATSIHPYFYLSKYATPHLSPGSIVISNAYINTYIGRPDLLDHNSTKGAIVSFMRGLSNNYVSRGIRANAVAPGMFTSSRGRLARPSDIATCFVFLAGRTIHANGRVVVNG